MDGTFCGCCICGQGPEAELYRSTIMRIVRCRKCSLVYQNPRTPETAMGDAYAAIPEYGKYGRQQEAKAAMFAERIDRLRQNLRLPASGRFLDVGASMGTMMRSVQQALPGWQAEGVEPSEIARRESGLRLAADVSELSGEFDWVNLDNTLEHFDDPVAGLRSLRPYLSAGGFVYIEVPNESRFGLRWRINDLIRGERKLPTFPGHMTLFTEPTLRKVIEAAGLRCERTWTESVSANHRLAAVCGQDEARYRWILRFLRATRADSILGLDYFLCAIARKD